MTLASAPSDWPALAYDDWADTAQTLHMWTQIVGKIRMALTPPVNHWWHVPLYVSARGLTTSPMPYGGAQLRDRLRLRRPPALDRMQRRPARDVRARAHERGGLLSRGDGRAGPARRRPSRIWTTPCEVENPIPFEDDEIHTSYDAEAAQRFWRVAGPGRPGHAASSARRFIGKASPVHFFWGSFDLAVTRFSGRRAPPHPGGVRDLPASVSAEAYSHEVSAAASGRARRALPSRCSTPTPIPSRRASPRRRCARRRPAGTPRWASSSCPTRPSATAPFARLRPADLPAVDLRRRRRSRRLAAGRPGAPPAARSLTMTDPVPAPRKLPLSAWLGRPRAPPPWVRWPSARSRWAPWPSAR